MAHDTIPLVDSHCHLAWESFRDDLDDVLLRMAEAEVRDAVVVATDADTAERIRSLCEDHPGLHPTAGIHPNDLPDDWQAEFARIEAMLRSGGFVAVGETGLDYYRDRVAREPQQEAFRAHAILARELDLPLIVHIRDQEGREDAFEDVARILESDAGERGVIHCYTGTTDFAERYRARGFFISFSGILTFPKGGNVREVALVTPLERTLVETDAPFLAPQPFRGKRNEPAFVAATAAALAELLGRDEAEIRQVTADNARALFRLPEQPARSTQS